MGTCHVFDGARNIHFTVENTTDKTRVTLDFRLALCRHHDATSSTLPLVTDIEDRFSANPGYYRLCVVDGQGHVEPMGHRPVPDFRVGFPFTKAKPKGKMEKEETTKNGKHTPHTLKNGARE